MPFKTWVPAGGDQNARLTINKEGSLAMDPLAMVRLPLLMSRSQGRRELAVALIDGPVALNHPDLAQSRIMPL